MNSLFALPLPASQQAKSSPDHVARKRKRSVHHQKLAEVNEGELSEYGRSISSQYTAVITPDERSQRLLAGQDLNEEPPHYPFPHARESSRIYRPVSKADPKGNETVTDRSMPNPRPNTAGAPTLRQQHFAVMTAILHRSLMERDWTRAGRALGLLLHDQVNGSSIDIRSAGMWGFGAEILLRQGTQQHQSNQPTASLHADDARQTEVHPRWYTRDGFEKVRRYYETLITEFAFHKSHPAATNALDFYPALYGLWICVVQDAAETGELPATKQQRWNMDPLHSFLSPELEEKIRILECAGDIANHLEATITTYPFRDHIELLRLKAMVSLWLADLIDKCVAQMELWSSEGNGSNATLADVEARIRTATSSTNPGEGAEETLRGKSLRYRLHGRELLEKLTNG